MDFDNAAFRLLDLLEMGKKIPADRQCRTAWAELLDVGVNNCPELHSKLGKVMELSSTIVTEIRDAYPDEHDTCDHWSTQVDNAFNSQQLNGQWATFISCIDQHSINYLRMHARLLQNISKTKPVAEGVLEATRKELDSILRELLASDVDAEVKRYLSRNLRKLIAAVDEYKLTGSAAIFDSIEILMGHSVFDAKYKESITETSIGKRIVELLGILANAMTVAQGLPQISEVVSGFIAVGSK